MATPKSRQPAPRTGRKRPDPFDTQALARAEAAEAKLAAIWVQYEPQQAILVQLRRYMRLCKQQQPGTAFNGRRLSQVSQAGKSSTIERLRKELADEERAAGLAPNPLRLLHVTMDRRMTVKMLFQQILNQLGDNFVNAEWRDNGTVPRGADRARWSRNDNIKMLEQRIAEWVPKLGVECIAVDEVQHLDRPTDDACEVTKKLQAFLDSGIVPMVFIGDDTSRKFFASNPQFAARLLRPLELRQLDVKKSADRAQFMRFCQEFDRQLLESGIVNFSCGFDEPDTLEGLIAVSGGHVGRVARLIQTALPAALERGAATIEPYDLSNAAREYAIDLGWIDYDPFAIKPK